MAEKKDKVAAEPAKKTNAALDAVLSQIKKEFGELSIMRLGGAEHANIPVISTGALSLDLAETLVESAIDECERFYPVFQFVLWGGKSPKEALAAALIDTQGEA